MTSTKRESERRSLLATTISSILKGTSWRSEILSEARMFSEFVFESQVSEQMNFLDAILSTVSSDSNWLLLTLPLTVLSQRVKHCERVKPSYTSLLDTRNGFSGSGQGIGQTELLKEAYRLSTSLRSRFRCLPAFFFRSSALTQSLAQARYGFHNL